MGCKYCELVEKKANVLYEDEKVIAIVPPKPLAKGHIQVIAKEHKASMQDFDDKDLEHLFYTASFGATSLFENLEAHGTNIIAQTGGQLKQDGHFHIDVVARKNDDTLNFLWKPKQLGEDEMKAVQGKIKDKCDMMDVKKEKKCPVDLDKKPEKLESTEEKASGAEERDAKEPAETVPSEKAEPDETGCGRPGDIPSEEEQMYRKKEKEEARISKGLKEDKESYLIKQLRRVP
ncbi:HIT family protein [Candidatus Woesearchaeota archaeon]|nr:HIT family protein [Candidatus Woesearchaeota archaeon]